MKFVSFQHPHEIFLTSVISKRLGFGPVVKYLQVTENEFFVSGNVDEGWDRAVVAASEKYSNMVHNICW